MATATNTPKTDPKEVLKRVEDDGIEFIRFWFTDIEGQLKSFAVGKEELEGAFEEGMGFDGSSITGFNAIEESDMIAMPDPDTYSVLPWRDDGGQGKGNVARLFCDVLKPGGEPYEGDPRCVMRQALARAEEMGFDTFNLGPELEFFYFASDEVGENGLPTILDKGGYFDLTTLDAASDLRRDTVNALKAARDPGRVHPPRGRALAARDRHALRRGAADVRQRDDLPDRRQGDRAYARRLRDVHAEAAVRRERLRDAHPPVAVLGRHERLLRRGRSVPPLGHGEGVHRRAAQARARDLRAVRPQREQLQAAGARATRRRSTAPGRSATARPSSGCRCTTRARRRRRGASCAAPIPPATPT